MRFLKHLGSLVAEIFQFAWQNKVWWIIPVFFVFLGIGLLIVVGETAAPFIYTLFQYLPIIKKYVDCQTSVTGKCLQTQQLSIVGWGSMSSNQVSS